MSRGAHAGGALPAADLLAKAGTLTRHQRAVLDVLIDNPGGLDVAALASLTTSHPNTVRGHLSALSDRGLVSFHKREDGQKGRPALVYRASSALPESPAAHLVDLMKAALGTIPDEERDATAYAWGRAWGGRIDKARPSEDIRSTAATVMTEMGFAPAAQENGVDLYRCPLMSDPADMALGICQIHQGMLDELAALRGGRERITVIPAATSTTCRLSFGDAN